MFFFQCPSHKINTPHARLWSTEIYNDQVQDEPGNYGAGFLGLRYLTKSWMVVLQSSSRGNPINDFLLMDDWYYIFIYIYMYIDINGLPIPKQWPSFFLCSIWWITWRLMVKKSYMLLGTGYSHWTHHFSHVGPKDCSLLNCVKLWCDVSKLIHVVSRFLVCFQILSNMQVTSDYTYIHIYIYTYIITICFLHVKI